MGCSTLPLIPSLMVGNYLDLDAGRLNALSRCVTKVLILSILALNPPDLEQSLFQKKKNGEDYTCTDRISKSSLSAHVSVDTNKPQIMKRLQDFGVSVVNDIKGGADDETLRELADQKMTYVAMHMHLKLNHAS